MTREEAINILNRDDDSMRKGYFCINDFKAIEVLKSEEPKMEQFAKWVATEIFDDYWEYNYEAFVEIACRKLAKLGIVVRMGDEWELVEQESEEV